MKGLFVNGGYGESACGVAQYGKNLYAIIKESRKIFWDFCEPKSLDELRSRTGDNPPDLTLINFQNGQGGFLSEAPFSFLGKQALVYHDGPVDETRWSAILFSDPTFVPNGKWKVIGRPLPKSAALNRKTKTFGRPVFGVHGFIGAWADQVVWRVMQEFEEAIIRLSLPFARYGDADGAAAMTMANRCRNMVVGKKGISLEISHEFLQLDDLLQWLCDNDLNCYLRPADMNWRGISSAPDAALAVGRPFAINKCNAFRHLHGLSPSICVEDNSLLDIFANGLSPLVEFKARWCDPDVILNQVEAALDI